AGAPAAPLEMHATAEPVIELARHAAREAMHDARLAVGDSLRERTGCVIGTSKGGIRSFTRAAEHGPRPGDGDPAAHWTDFLPHAPAQAVARDHDVRGPVL